MSTMTPRPVQPKHEYGYTKAISQMAKQANLAAPSSAPTTNIITQNQGCKTEPTLATVITGRCPQQGTMSPYPSPVVSAPSTNCSVADSNGNGMISTRAGPPPHTLTAPISTAIANATTAPMLAQDIKKNPVIHNAKGTIPNYAVIAPPTTTAISPSTVSSSNTTATTTMQQCPRSSACANTNYYPPSQQSNTSIDAKAANLMPFRDTSTIPPVIRMPLADKTQCTLFKRGIRCPHKATYASLITMAIHSSPNKRLMLHQIYSFVDAHRIMVPAAVHPNWKNSVRHNLSLRPCFRKVPRWSMDGKKLSAYWELDMSLLPPAAAQVILDLNEFGPIYFPFHEYIQQDDVGVSGSEDHVNSNKKVTLPLNLQKNSKTPPRYNSAPSAIGTNDQSYAEEDSTDEEGGQTNQVTNPFIYPPGYPQQGQQQQQQLTQQHWMAAQRQAGTLQAAQHAAMQKMAMDNAANPLVNPLHPAHNHQGAQTAQVAAQSHAANMMQHQQQLQTILYHQQAMHQAMELLQAGAVPEGAPAIHGMPPMPPMPPTSVPGMPPTGMPGVAAPHLAPYGMCMPGISQTHAVQGTQQQLAQQQHMATLMQQHIQVVAAQKAMEVHATAYQKHEAQRLGSEAAQKILAAAHVQTQAQQAYQANQQLQQAQTQWAQQQQQQQQQTQQTRLNSKPTLSTIVQRRETKLQLQQRQAQYAKTAIAAYQQQQANTAAHLQSLTQFRKTFSPGGSDETKTFRAKSRKTLQDRNNHVKSQKYDRVVPLPMPTADSIGVGSNNNANETKHSSSSGDNNEGPINKTTSKSSEMLSVPAPRDIQMSRDTYRRYSNDGSDEPDSDTIVISTTAKHRNRKKRPAEKAPRNGIAGTNRVAGKTTPIKCHKPQRSLNSCQGDSEGEDAMLAMLARAANIIDGSD